MMSYDGMRRSRSRDRRVGGWDVGFDRSSKQSSISMFWANTKMVNLGTTPLSRCHFLTQPAVANYAPKAWLSLFPEGISYPCLEEQPSYLLWSWKTTTIEIKFLIATRFLHYQYFSTRRCGNHYCFGCNLMYSFCWPQPSLEKSGGLINLCIFSICQWFMLYLRGSSSIYCG